MVSVEIREGREALEALTEEWTSLLGDTFTSAFASPGWHLAALDAFPARSAIAIVARMGGQLAGVLPLARMKTDARGLYLNRVTFPGRGDYNAPAICWNAAEEVLPAILEAAM